MTSPFGAMYEIAKTFTTLGYAVIPCDYRHKEASVKWAVYQVCIPSHDEVSRWFAHRITNAAILTGCHGFGYGLIVIDFDNMQDYELWQRWAREQYPLGLEAYTVRTRRGMHVYLTSSNAGKLRNLHYGGVDVKGAGGYVMLPGSIHPSGFVYEAVDSENLFFPSFETLEQVLPPEILNRYVEPTVHAPGESPAFSELSMRAILDRPFGVRSLKVENVKHAHRIEEFIPKIQDTGNGWYVAKCPFHEPDNNSSFWVDSNRQICGCYKGCTGSRVMDVVNLYSRLKGVSNRDALIALSNI